MLNKNTKILSKIEWFFLRPTSKHDFRCHIQVIAENTEKHEIGLMCGVVELDRNLSRDAWEAKAITFLSRVLAGLGSSTDNELVTAKKIWAEWADETNEVLIC